MNPLTHLIDDVHLQAAHGRRVRAVVADLPTMQTLASCVSRSGDHRAFIHDIWAQLGGHAVPCAPDTGLRIRVATGAIPVLMFVRGPLRGSILVWEPDDKPEDRLDKLVERTLAAAGVVGGLLP